MSEPTPASEHEYEGSAAAAHDLRRSGEAKWAREQGMVADLLDRVSEPGDSVAGATGFGR